MSILEVRTRYGVYEKRSYLTAKRSTDPLTTFVLDKARLLISMPTLNDEVSRLEDKHTPSLVSAPFRHPSIR